MGTAVAGVLAPGLRESFVGAMILIVLPWNLIHPGGVNEVVRNLLRQYCRRLRIRPVLLVSDWQALNPQPCEASPTWECIRLRLREPFDRTGMVRSLLTYIVDVPRMVGHIRAIVKKWGITTISVHYPSPGTLTFALLRVAGLCRARLLTTFHGSDLEEAVSARGVRRWAWKAVIRWSDAISTVSESLRISLLETFPEGTGKTWTIPNGIDPERLEEERREWASAGGEWIRVEGRFVLSVGNYVPAKGQDTLVRAFARVVASIGDSRLVIVGRQGPSLGALRALVSELGLSSRVTLLVDEPHARVMDLFDRAEMFVLPSNREGFPVVLLEAGYKGLPVLANRVGGISELIDSGRDGLLLDPEDTNALAGNIERLWVDRKLAHRLGAALQRKVLDTFTWERAAQQYLGIMDVEGGD